MTAEGPQVRILLGAVTALGPGKATLIEAIATTGSISAAGRQLGMSYRRAWTLVDAMNRSFRRPLVVAATGGRRGGGAKVTPMGERVLLLYRRMETNAAASIAKDLKTLKCYLRS